MYYVIITDAPYVRVRLKATYFCSDSSLFPVCKLRYLLYVRLGFLTAPCPYEPVEGYPQAFRLIDDSRSVQYCVTGMEFTGEPNCTCIVVGPSMCHIHTKLDEIRPIHKFTFF